MRIDVGLLMLLRRDGLISDGSGIWGLESVLEIGRLKESSDRWIFISKDSWEKGGIFLLVEGKGVVGIGLRGGLFGVIVCDGLGLGVEMLELVSRK